ncbi:MAG: helix-turn-helix domain-containing protein [Synergistaceae bacterium]|jgi:YesN/AraC family two-component response regulator|nr:helix-turn-helix domain-containing protein [Synergistaceae bacterium]
MCRIVVVDDEYLEREFIKKVLRSIENTEVVGEGGNGDMAVELCSVLKPDIVFLNCGMGAFGGLEAAARIRLKDRDVVIVLTSADEDNFQDKDERHTPLNIAEYLLKPIRAETIREIVLKRGGRGKSSARIPAKMKKHLKFYPLNIMSREITLALAYIDAHYGEDISLDSVADVVSLSSYYFSRLFKKEVGVNFSRYVLHKRLEAAKRTLEETEDPITDIATSVGFHEGHYFGKKFKKFTGSTPSEYRKKLALLEEERKNVRGKYQEELS